MPRRPLFVPGAYYHIYNRGHNKRTIFVSRDNCSFFLGRLRESVAQDCADVIAYCLMPNHFHLLLKLRNAELSPAMQRLSVSYAKAINRQRKLVGSLFQGPFQAIHVDDETYLLHLTRYIHLNPREATLVDKPEDWEFSSHRDDIGLRNGTLPQPEPILREFATPDHYRTFVESRSEAPNALSRYLTRE